MSKVTKYVSHTADENGNVKWSSDENRVWQDLVERQLECIKGRACDEYMQGLDLLDLPKDRVPQLAEVNQVLAVHTGWQVEQVPSLINFDAFFNLLANKKFPVATFIRSREDFDYLQEPDIFHEIFGHCPLLTNPAFAHFTHTYGKLGLAASKEDRAYLARLYWFTVEFGLLHTAQGPRIYGGGILSSPGETVYALESDVPDRLPLEPLEVLRTPYRIDIMQPVYFMLNHFEQLFDLAQMDVMALVNTAKKLGLHPAKFEAKNKLAS
ncbi:phenylalanine 4-monooxygenase [Aliiglaciecola sp. LCG003]|uniref:phenylalanine 4-monooxygenase n=1 Tax=Aliiglaciecola sp. LCG003 TaxID=3053655 RepID=UPI002573CBF6|nr:phenylalanine 4-monooxygenase [Aliiglaciecola sp. LCG003]WJG08365.1 phenylalanine 4-monooxygenase [Aliiglaciecola sp. LCG003]